MAVDSSKTARLLNRDDLKSLAARRRLFSKFTDLTNIPDDLLDVFAPGPGILDTHDRGLSFQRTPNVFPMGRLTFAAAGSLEIAAATPWGALNPGGGPYDLKPSKPGVVWWLLGGRLVVSVLATSTALVVVRPFAGGKQTPTGRAFATGSLPNTAAAAAAVTQDFTIPVNGGKIVCDLNSSIEIVCSQITTVDFILYVAEDLPLELPLSKP